MSRPPRPGLPVSSILDAAFFALYGCAFFAWWVATDPSHEQTETQGEWPYVVAFSGVILLLGLALPRFSRLAGDRLAFRASLVVAGGAVLGSVANVFEDGLKLEWVFFVFVFSLLLIDLGLLALVIVLAVRGRGDRRALALVPAGPLLAIIFGVEVGGPLMLVTWIGAAVLALVLPGRTAVQPVLESA